MRGKLTTLAELAGMALVAIGAGLAYVPAGLMTGGAFLGLVGYLAASS